MFKIRLIQAQDNPHIARIIRDISKEYGLAPESGFAVADPILDDLYQVYQQADAAYWVIEDDLGEILGGGGCAPLQGDSSLIEIQKMYFTEKLRGHGFAKKILNHAFEFAQKHQYTACYLETTECLWQAVKLYEKIGFEYLDQPRGNTGHSQACKTWMLKNLH